MKRMLPLLTLIFSLFVSTFAHAQERSGLDTTMRSSGRIYVVIAVILVILAGLILYLVRLDRKISKLEKM
jgi:hypothetical protein